MKITCNSIKMMEMHVYLIIDKLVKVISLFDLLLNQYSIDINSCSRIDAKMHFSNNERSHRKTIEFLLIYIN